MKQTLLQGVLFCLLLSCGKHNDKPADPDNPPSPSKKNRIKSISGNNYFYDSLGRLSRNTYSNSLTARTEYTYTKDSIVSTDFDLQGRPRGAAAVFYLGNNGLATAQKFLIDPSLPPIILTFYFNTSRQIVEQLALDGNVPTTRRFSYYSNGNQDSVKTFSIQTGDLVQAEKFEYYKDQPNQLDNEASGISFIGVGSANLVKKETQVNNGATTVIEYTYEFDSQKRPVKRHMIVDGAPFSDLTYTWF